MLKRYSIDELKARNGVDVNGKFCSSVEVAQLEADLELTQQAEDNAHRNHDATIERCDAAEANVLALQGVVEKAIGRMTELETELDGLKELLLKDRPWAKDCEIIPAYLPPFPQPNTRPIVAIRYNSGSDTPPFLRYSRGPAQGFFWDIYGDDFQSMALATIALSRAPAPRSVDPIKFTLNLRQTTQES